MNKVVIVGAGQAAGWAVYTLRAEGYTGEIHVVSNESTSFMNAHLYPNRCCLKKRVLRV